ncbi:3'-5' exonuclease [Leptospira bandrabouensis]|uniref:3'-5' exonuclease n=1 Tax=Leptospira bandrabouensis TaxID=2484903 RepID=UPI00223CF363|nr:3'-5' exonuclease [Leptospira bandrabouensis]MCW7479454.1 3'-5' exonuclease [Leptospira bandrabouensis]MCW7487137.1 3'-5' exonuclease [Leptospira bandrabouensis]
MKNNLNNILILDTETGGIDPNTDSILTIAMLKYEEALTNPPTEIGIIPYGKKIKKSAIKYNNINNDLNNINFLPKEEAGKFITNYLENKFDLTVDKITLLGHNIGFDINFLKTFFKDLDIDFYKYFSYRSIDTASILLFLYDVGKIKTPAFSLKEAYNLYINKNNNLFSSHQAFGDVFMTYYLYKSLKTYLE